MKKNQSKSLPILFTALFFLISLTACGTSDTSSTPDFDASGYVKSVLDANFHHEYTDYANYRGITEAEAIQELDTDLNAQINTELDGLDEMGDFSDEEKDEYKAMFKKIQELASYEVQDASRDNHDNFSVSLKLTPSNVYQTLEDHMTSVAQEMAGQGIDITETSNFQKLLIDSMQASIDENVYDKPVTIRVYVKKDTDGIYGISDSDMQKINDTLFPE